MARNFNFGGRQKFQNPKYVYVEDDDQVADLLQNVDLDSPSQKEQIHTIYVGNVDPEFILDDNVFVTILETFAKCGEIVSVSIPDGVPLTRGNTYFFIAYSTLAAAVKACQLHNLSPPYGFLVNHARRERTGTFSTRPFPSRTQRPFVPKTVPRNPSLTVVAGESGRRVSTGASPLQGRLSRFQQQDVNDENVVVCDVCDAQGILIICKGCDSKYCSKTCQERDFTRHRAACQKNLPSSGTQATRQSTGPMNRLNDENVEENNSARQSRVSNFRDGQFRNNQSEEADRSTSSVQNRLNRSENGFDSNMGNDGDKQRPYKNYDRQNNENESTPGKRFDNQRQPRDSQNFGDRRNFGSSNNENRDNSSYQTRDFNRVPRDNQDSGDRPRRNFSNRQSEGGDGDNRPRKNFNNRDSEGGDGDNRPRRNFNNRDSEGGDGDNRPRRNFNNRDSEGGDGDSRPRRNFNNRDSEGGDGDNRPRRNFSNRDSEGGDGDSRPRRNFHNRDSEGGDGDNRPRRNYNRDSEGGDGDNRPRRNFNRRDQGGNSDRENRDGQRRSFNRDSGNRGGGGDDNRRFGGGSRFSDGDRRPFDRNSRSGGTRFGEASTENNTDDDWSPTDPGQSDYLNKRMEAAKSGPVLGLPPPSTTVELPSGVYTPVSICNQEGPLLYCAQRVQDQELNTKLLTDTAKCIDTLSPIQQLSDGLFCLAKYMDGWYRAIVKQITPKLVVYFIDYANDFDCSPTDLREIPSILCDTPRLGLKIEFVPGSPEKYGNLVENQVVSVMPVKTNENGVIIVKTEDFEGVAVATEAAVSVSQGQPKAASAAEFPIPQDVYTLVAIVYKVTDSERTYWVQTAENAQTSNELHAKLFADAPNMPVCEPLMATLCCALYEGMWCRARIIKTSPELQVQFLDYGNIEVLTPDVLRTLPEYATTVPPLAFKVILKDKTPEEKYKNLQENETINIKPLSKSLGAVIVELEGTQDITPAVQTAAVTVPAQTADTAPVQAPVTVPVQAPVTVPVQAPVTVPVQAPVTVPVQAPVTVPGQAPVTVPGQAPVTVSIQPVTEDMVRISVVPKAHTEELVTPVPSNENKMSTDIIEGVIVYIVPDSDKEFYVQKVENRATAEELIIKLHSECPQQPECTPVSGLLCSALYHNLWYRAKILSVEPSIQVFFIDYGNVDTVPIEQLHVLPDEFKNLPPLCFLVRVEDGTPAELYQNLKPDLDVFKFRIVSEVDGKSIISFKLENVAEPLATVVHTTEQAVGQTIAPVESSAKRKTDYLSSFEVGDVGAVEVLKIYEDFCTVLILLEKSADYFHLKTEINDGAEEFPETPAFVPKIGDFAAVYASLECLWHRGFILGVEENKVLAMFCDAGRIEKVVRLKELPEKYLGYPMLALRQEVLKNNTTQALQEGQKFVFEVSSISADRVVGSLKGPHSPDALYEVRLSTWEPRLLDYMDYRYVEFSTVRLQSFCRNIVSVVSASSKDEELYQEMQAILNSHCATVSPMQRLPKIADVVACLSSEGGTYSRGIVKKVNESLAKVKVFCVDTGCEVVATLDKVKPLTLQLKSYPFRANVFKLNGVKDVDLPDEACKLLQALIDTKTPLRLDGLSSVSEGIMLYKSTGECVNGKILLLQQTKQGQTSLSQVIQTHQVSTPSVPATQSSSNTEPLLASRLPFKELSIGSCKLFPWLISDDLELFCCVPDPEFVQAVTETMAAEIQEFCESTTETHCPLMQELCLAKYDADGTWYRAVCTKISSADTTEVELVDFGNILTVENSKIRKMPEKFLTLPRMVVKCTIEGLEVPTDENRKRLIFNSMETNKPYDVKVLRLISIGSYLVSFPEILETLRSKSLV